MTLRRLLVACLGILAHFLTRPLHAQPREVVIERGGREPRCLKVDELRASILRDTGLRVSDAVQGQGQAAGADVVRLKVAEEGDSVEIALLGGGLDVRHRVTAATCTTATDVVAAFVASALAPARLPAVTAAPATEASALETQVTEKPTGVTADALAGAVRKELRTRGAPGAGAGATVRFEQAADGTWLASIDGPAAHCNQVQWIGPVKDLRPARVRALAEHAHEMEEQYDACTRNVEDRAAAMAATLRDKEAIPRWGSALVSGSFTALNGLLFGVLLDTSGWRPLTGAMLANVGTCASATVAILALPDDYSQTMLRASSVASLGSSSLALELGNGPKMAADGVGFTAGVTFYALAAIELGDAIRRRPVGGETLRRDYETIDTPVKRARLRAATFAGIEEHYDRSRQVGARWLMAGTALVGGTVTTALTVEGLRHEKEKGIGFIPSAGLLTLGISYASNLDPYRRRLKAAGLDVSLAPSPGGLSLYGRF